MKRNLYTAVAVARFHGSMGDEAMIRSLFERCHNETVGKWGWSFEVESTTVTTYAPMRDPSDVLVAVTVTSREILQLL